MDIRKLQRAIVDGLEDVKGQNIAVFNTEHLSPLFERVIIASGTSNRQTKALASSVRDAVKHKGFGVMRTEGEGAGEEDHASRVKLLLVAVGQRQPGWAQTAYDDFAKRFPPELRLELKAVKAEPRGSKTAEQLMAAEASRLEASIPKGARRIVLD